MTEPNKIERHTIKTRKGNYISIFYNMDTCLFVVDLVRADEKGGNEFVRKILDEDWMLPSDDVLTELEQAEKVNEFIVEHGRPPTTQELK